MEAVELRKNQLAVLLVLGSCGLRWLPGACGSVYTLFDVFFAFTFFFFAV